MRIVFMGTPDFAVPCLQALLQQAYEVVGVFTQPDKPKGRGYKMIPPPVKAAAVEAGLSVYQPLSLRKGEEAEQAMQTLQELNPDVIVVDPPRKGCDEHCLSTMLAMGPDRIVYVSCDSATLARDLRILVDGGYELRRIRAFDQFAHSGHVETVVALHRTDM